MSEKQLKFLNARRMVVESKPGTPGRASLADAEIGETVIVVHYAHQSASSPYEASPTDLEQ